jgi:hypothetical protein
VTRLGDARGVVGVVGGRLRVFGDSLGAENVEAPTVGWGVRGESSRGGRSPRRRLGGLRGGEVMAESEEDRHPMRLEDLWGLENIFMLVCL